MNKRFVKILAWLTGSVFSLFVMAVIAAALGFSWLGSDPGRSWIAGQISQKASTAEYQITIGEIKTLNTRHIVLSYIRVSDQDGALGRLEGIKIDYRVESLLGGTIHIDNLDIEDILVNRLPATPESDKRQTLSLPDLSHLRIDSMRAGTIALDESLTGEAEELSLEGSLALAPALFNSVLELHIRDKITGHALADLVFNPGGKSDIKLQARVQDKGKSVLTRLTGLPSLDVNIDGTGTVANWDGTMTLAIGEELDADYRIGIDLSGKATVITIDGPFRYEGFSTNGTTKFTVWPEQNKVDVTFSGQLTTPDVALQTLSVQAAFQPDGHIMRGGALLPVRLGLEGTVGRVIPAQSGQPLKELENAFFSVGAHVSETSINIKDSRIRTAFADIAAKGRISTDTADVKLESTVTIADMKTLDPVIDGQAMITTVLQGTYRPLSLQAPITVNVENLVTPWLPVNEAIGAAPFLTADLTYADERLTISGGTLRAAQLENTTFSGVAGENEQSFKLSTLYQEHQASGDISIAGDTLIFDNVSIQGPAVSVASKGTFGIKEQQLQAQLELNPADNMSMSLALSGSLNELTAKGAWKGSGAHPYAFTCDAVLTAQHDIALALNSFTGNYGPNKISLNQKSVILYEDDTLKIAGLEIGVNDGTITTSGSFGQDNFALDLIADNIPSNLAVFPFVYDGRINGTVTGSGSYSAPVAEAEFALKRIAVPGLEETNDRFVEGVLTARYQGNVLTAATDLKGPAGLLFKGGGTLPLILSPPHVATDKPVNADLEASVDLRAISILLGLDVHRIRGQTALDVSLTGTLNSPVITGTGALTDGVYENLLTGTYFRDITATIEGRENVLHLTGFSGQDRNGGKFTGAGKVFVRNLNDPRYELSLDADKLQLVNLERMGLTASGKMSSEGDKESASVAGDISINHAEYYIDEIISTNVLDDFEIIEMNGHETTPEAPPPETYAEEPEVNLDVKIKANNSVFVRGPDLETEWGGNLAVSGTARNPVLKGNMTLNRGLSSFSIHLLP